MRIAYVGDNWGTSLHRARALQRLGHEVFLVSPRQMLPASRLVDRWLRYTGAAGAGALLNKRIFSLILSHKADLVWVNQGECVGPQLLNEIHAEGILAVNYINDDPFRIDREWFRFRLYRAALPFYDLAIVCRAENVNEAKAAGARNVLRVWMTTDEIEHAPRDLSAAQLSKLRSDVAFIGTWMPERGPFVAKLIAEGIPISIWGDRWQKAPEWPVIAPHWRGPGVYTNEYADTITAAKICIGLVSKGNRDLHTRRSIEVPTLRSVLCAERTSEHLELYNEGEEAVFWNNAEECAALCKALLIDERRRRDIAAKGHQRALRNGHVNERMLRSGIDAVLSLSSGVPNAS